jgi:hypothetical protein
MKRIYILPAFLIVIFFASCSSTQNSSRGNYNQDYSSQPPVITYQQFYDDLSPYGYWINYPGYGYCWIPNEQGFRPYYTNGHWVYTNYGWTWVSNYNWGWAPFHYGRWMNNMDYGWIWVPGYEWAPAWVSWRGGGDYYGWAPMQPGMNNYMGSIPDYDWTFVPNRYINSPRINNYYINQSRNITIINNTNIINNNNDRIINRNNSGYRPAYNPGPSATDVERSTRMKIRQFNVVESNKPAATQINNNSVRLFRPSIKEQPTNSGNTRPPRIVNLQEIQNNRRDNNTNRGNQNNESNSPVRQLPNNNQIPQINRNEPPVNNPASNKPVLEPKRNNEPVRIMPKDNPNNRVINNEPPVNNPVNNKPVLEPKRNDQPVRMLPNNNQPPRINRNVPPVNNTQPTNPPQRKEEKINNIPPKNNQNIPTNPPVRKFIPNENPPANNNNNANNNIRNSNNFQRNEKKIFQQNPQVIRQQKEIINVKPAQHGRELPAGKNENK